MRTIVGFIFFSLVELVPLWAITTEGVGGLGASPRDVGHFMTLAAVANITFTVAALGRCVARLSQRRSLAATGAAAAAGFVLLSLVRGPGVYPPSWAPSACFGFTAGAFSLVYMASMVGTTASIGLTNSVAPPAQRGLVNGIAVTVEGVGREWHRHSRAQSLPLQCCRGAASATLLCSFSLLYCPSASPPWPSPSHSPLTTRTSAGRQSSRVPSSSSSSSSSSEGRDHGY
jgi:hypothetical protein